MRILLIIPILITFICKSSFGQQLSPAQQMADFDTLCAKLECVHPDLYLYQSGEEYERNKAKMKASLTDSISFYQYIRLLSENSSFYG